MLVSLLNGLIEIIYLIAMGLGALLPDSPFDFTNLTWGAFGDLIGFFFPINAMFMHMSAILGAFIAYYAVRWALRLIRQIQ